MNVPMGDQYITDLTHTHTHTQTYRHSLTHKVGVFTMTEEPNINVENSPLFFDVWTFNQYTVH